MCYTHIIKRGTAQEVKVMFITVINGKRTYNLSEIMRQAWVAFRTSKQTFSECLKRAWATAKSVMRSILAVENEAEQAAKSV